VTSIASHPDESVAARPTIAVGSVNAIVIAASCFTERTTPHTDALCSSFKLRPDGHFAETRAPTRRESK
jgi:hypothetical protein